MGTYEGGIDDPSRPTYHHTAGCWMNDVIPHYDGDRLHVWFDHNPREAKWARFGWGHSSTADFVSWERHPVSLMPQEDTDDGYGCWTGTVFEGPDGPLAAYTGIRSFEPFAQTQCIASSKDLDAWVQPPAAVITETPEGFGDCFRDPFVYPHGDGWRMLVGSQVREPQAAAVLLYESPDLETWTYLGPFYVDDTGDLGSMAECPELFELDGRMVLITSAVWTRAIVGELDAAGRFVRTGPLTIFDRGHSYAARSAWVGNRRIQIGWVRDTRGHEDREQAGWSGALSLPRDLTLHADGSLHVEPVPELVALRSEQVHDGPIVPTEAGTVVPGPERHAIEAIVTLDPCADGVTTLCVGCGPDRIGGFSVAIDWRGGTIGEHELGDLAAGRLELRVFLDRSVLEVFVLGRVLTLRSYELIDEPRLALRHEGAPTAAHVVAWHLEPSTF